LSLAPSGTAAPNHRRDRQDLMEISNMKAEYTPILILASILVAGPESPAQGTPLWVDTFDNNNLGWNIGPTWAIGPATASSGQFAGNPDPAVDGSGTPNGGVAGVVIGGNAPISPHAYYYLESPVLLVPPGQIWISFDRHLNSDVFPYMKNTVDVWDGATWTTLWTSGGFPPIYDSAWTTFTFQAPQNTSGLLKIRFGYEIGMPGAWSVSSWNIDNLVVSGAPAPAPFPWLFETFDDNSNAWNMSATDWEIGPATASPSTGYGNPDPPFDADGVFGGGVAGVVIGGIASSNMQPYEWLVGPVVDTASIPGQVWLTFDRFLNSDYAPHMNNRIDVYDGTNWTTIWQSGVQPPVLDSEWTRVGYDVTAYKNAGFRVRFGYEIGTNSAYPSSSWNIDNVSIGRPAAAIILTSPCGSYGPTLSGTTPILGSSVALTITGGEPNATGLLIMGGPAPPISIFGSACTIDVQPALYMALTLDPSGGWSFPATLPTDPILDGAVLELQAVMFGASGLSVSGVLRLEFGYSV
jgi:hypothetical protein